MTSPNNFFFLNELFFNLGAVNSPSEVQGMLCGKLVCGQKMTDEQWFSEIISFMDIEHVGLNEEQHEALTVLHKTTRELLSKDDFSFSPLLPDDSSTLLRRSQELGFWCQGFLHGVGTSGLDGETAFSADVADAIRDLAQISQLNVEDDEDNEENENDLMELVEYVKVAVLTIYAELNVVVNIAGVDDSSESSGDDPTLH